MQYSSNCRIAVQMIRNAALRAQMLRSFIALSSARRFSDTK